MVRHVYKFLRELDPTLLFLWGCIILFAVIGLLLLSLTFIKRRHKIRKRKKAAAYLEEIERLLFSLIFEQHTVKEVIAQYWLKPKDYLYKKLLIRSVITLHRNYSGNQKLLLEQFYAASNLVDYSFAKLRSFWWKHKVEGIRDLTAMNIKDAVPEIKAALQHPNEMVQKEALIGLISQEGFSLMDQSEIDGIYIDDWSQSCILYNMKQKQQTFPDDITYLLQSRNESLVLLAARIIDFFQLYTFYQPLLQSGQQLKTRKYQQDLGHIKQRIKTFMNNEY